MFVWACGSAEKSPTSEPIKPEQAYAAELAPLVDAYEMEALESGTPVPEDFRNQLVQVIWQDDLGREGDEVILGRCERMNENSTNPDLRFRTIKIHKPDAQGYIGGIHLDEKTLRTIVYHELGHCLHDYHGHLPISSRQIMSAELPTDRLEQLPILVSQHFELMKSQSKAD